MVLLIEDNPADVFLVEEAIKLHRLNVRLLILEDGEKALRWVEANDEAAGHVRPSVVVLDLNLPRRSGAEVLAGIRSSRLLRDTPVIIFTSSNSNRDRLLRDQYPNTTYLKKSADFDEFMRIGDVIKATIAAGTERTAN